MSTFDVDKTIIYNGGISKTGAPTPGLGTKTYYLARFLHENTRNWTGGGERTSLGSANDLFD